jgi:hypothetical protein
VESYTKLNEWELNAHAHTHKRLEMCRTFGFSVVQAPFRSEAPDLALHCVCLRYQTSSPTTVLFFSPGLAIPL